MHINKFVLIVVVTIFSSSILAQNSFNDNFSHDVSINYGIFPSLASNPEQPSLVGSIVNVDYAYFFQNGIGYRTGLNFINNLEGVNNAFLLPVLFSYRSKTKREFVIGPDFDSFSDFLFQVILGLIPKQAEYNIGINVGFINPNNNVGGPINPDYNNEFFIKNRFVTSIDAGLRLTYRIRRVGIVLSPSVGYFLTNNFEYYSDSGLNNGYTPDWFMKITFGLSYRF